MISFSQLSSNVKKNNLLEKMGTKIIHNEELKIAGGSILLDAQN